MRHIANTSNAKPGWLRLSTTVLLLTISSALLTTGCFGSNDADDVSAATELPPSPPPNTLPTEFELATVWSAQDFLDRWQEVTGFVRSVVASFAQSTISDFIPEIDLSTNDVLLLEVVYPNPTNAPIELDVLDQFSISYTTATETVTLTPTHWTPSNKSYGQYLLDSGGWILEIDLNPTEFAKELGVVIQRWVNGQLSSDITTTKEPATIPANGETRIWLPFVAPIQYTDLTLHSGTNTYPLSGITFQAEGSNHTYTTP